MKYARTILSWVALVSLLAMTALAVFLQWQAASRTARAGMVIAK